jgi:hypothetical protein
MKGEGRHPNAQWSLWGWTAGKHSRVVAEMRWRQREAQRIDRLHDVARAAEVCICCGNPKRFDHWHALRAYAWHVYQGA